ncbi:DNA ligase D [Sutcliffiella horikoshii]|uniref:DNA ligase D n=1 Tax=Sutcliffiella horikoshii TaxID=79883 RepID=UPI00203D422F|nr:DNA ligase D [Sutcliffiella horikoshii]MCM3616754.1 DNA ligase D [Sutcliffiella horikoshii]
MIKPMLPTLHRDAPMGKEWGYEVKYDGFRCLVMIEQGSIMLQSRNGKELNSSFPDIISYIKEKIEVSDFLAMLPLTLDCELVVLTSTYKANFAAIQKRGRTKAKEKIDSLTYELPATLLAFDLLTIKGENLHSRSLRERKEKLLQLFEQLHLPLSPTVTEKSKLQYVPTFFKHDELWSQIQLEQGEGIIAKKLSSPYITGKRTTDWIKVKNYKTVTCFITSYQKENGYFHVGVFHGGQVQELGLFTHGLSSEEKSALIAVIKQNSMKEDSNYIYVEPGICLDVYYLELYQNQLRHPEFKQFRFDVEVEECTFKQMSKIQLPISVTITHPDKPLWEEPLVTKQDYLDYLSTCAPYLLPFIKNRLLTVIRYPHGMYGESFYQKNCPDYAPDFVETFTNQDINYMMCNNLETLIWLGNQLALEFHVPFQTIHTIHPSEIVFDLDPPSREYFSGAVTGALMMKEVFDQLKLESFIKTSGRKGLQVYIPLPEGRFSYDATRKFTEFIATYLVSKKPSLFTVERLKKHRGERVYVDYVQHGEGKTIISPYSLRGNELPTVATPLHWNEVKESLKPEDFTIYTVAKRLKGYEDPFQRYSICKDDQPFENVLAFLENNPI